MGRLDLIGVSSGELQLLWYQFDVDTVIVKSDGFFRVVEHLVSVGP
jgi:hypothetical protein